MLLIISILTLIIVICHFPTIFTWRKPVPAMPHWFVFAPDGFSKHPMLARLTLSCLSLLMPIEEGTIIPLHHKKSPRHISLAFSAVMIVATASATPFLLILYHNHCTYNGTHLGIRIAGRTCYKSTSLYLYQGNSVRNASTSLFPTARLTS